MRTSAEWRGVPAKSRFRVATSGKYADPALRVVSHGNGVISPQSVAQGIENALRADDLGKMVPVEIRLQFVFHVRESQCDAVVGEVLLKFAYYLSGSVIYLGNGARIHQKPARHRG